MAKLMVGTEEVLKVMMGSEEVTSLFMGSEEIPQNHDAYLILAVSNVPSDGQVHTYQIYNSNDELLSELSIDTSDWSYTYTDDPDGYGYGFTTYNFDDGGDLSNGWFRWEIYGPFSGEYDVRFDSSSILTSQADFDGTKGVVYVEYDGSIDTMTDFSSYDEYDCMVNNCGNWDGTICDCM